MGWDFFCEQVCECVCSIYVFAEERNILRLFLTG